MTDIKRKNRGLYNCTHLNKLDCSALLPNIFHLFLQLNRNKTVKNAFKPTLV